MASNRKNEKKNSITRQMVFIILGVVAFMIILLWCFNSYFSEKFYRHTRLDVLKQAYEITETAASLDKLSDEEYTSEIDKFCVSNNLSLIVTDSEGHETFSSLGGKNMMRLFFDMLVAERNKDEMNLVEEADDYTIVRQKDPVMQEEFLCLYGEVANNGFVIIRVSVASISNSMKVYNKFLAFMGVVVTLLSVLIVIYVSRSFSRPVLQLTEISRRMSNLDFDAKYIPNGSGNEIDELGIHMNDMSEKLESTIKELKDANVKLLEDLDRRKKSEEQRTEFLSGVSHELKTPIAIIQGYAEGLEESVNDDEESRNYYCSVIKEEAQKMNKMVQEMLDLTRLEYGQDYINMERFNIIELIYGITGASKIIFEQNEIKVSLPKQTEVMVWADKNLTEKAFSNYLSNAIHYCKNEKEVRILVEEKEDTVRVKVYNSGDCIPEDIADRIWEKFYKGDKARTRSYGGNGIGLSVVRAVMSVLGRECGFYNENEGVTFWFEIDTARTISD